MGVMHSRVLLAAVGAALCVLPAPAAGVAARHPPRQHNPWVRSVEVLTRWHQAGYWITPRAAAWVHVAPSLRSHRTTQLHFRTEDGFPEVYLVLRRVTLRNGVTWLRIAIPMRPNGRTGWIVKSAAGPVHGVYRFLVVDRRTLRVRLFIKGKSVWSAPVGIGKPSTPTPGGLFWIREEFVLPDQTFYGPYAFGTSAYASITDWPGGGVVGLHGTSEPYLIPGRPSHGCIRLRNDDILWLADHVPRGTPVAIL
jgi:hypothetical protein